MTRLDKELVSAVLVNFAVGLSAGFPFGVWQGSFAAGAFMTMFVMVMAK